MPTNPLKPYARVVQSHLADRERYWKRIVTEISEVSGSGQPKI